MIPIKDYEHYFITDDGQVYGLRGRKLTQFINRDGYYKVGINKSGKQYNKQAHRLVALAFIPNPENKPQVNHKDGNKLNNNVNNLEWATKSENSIHAWKNGLNESCRIASKNKVAKLHQSNKKAILKWSLNGELISIFESRKDLMMYLGITSSKQIQECLKGERESAYGFKWTYTKPSQPGGGAPHP